MDVLNNTDIKIMTPGPTQVADNVYRARSLRTTNPDLDPAFYDFYRDTCHLFGKLIHTKNACFILGGEGILGLEAACASLTEPGIVCLSLTTVFSEKALQILFQCIREIL